MAKRKKRGRKPEGLKIRGDWQAAIKRALKKKRPPGWDKRKNQLK